MTRVVPFVHTLTADEESAWVHAIAKTLPEIAVRPLSDLTDDECMTAKVAIVANPDPAELVRLPALTWIQSLWAGVERLVQQTPPHVAIVRMVDPQLAETMAEAVLAWTLYLHRDMPRYASQQRSRLWRQHDVPRAADRCIGILGLGNMGQKAAQRLTTNGFSVVGWSRSPKQAPGIETFHGADGLIEVLKRADILVILFPLTDATKGLINASALTQMKPEASLINFGRGAIVDTAAMVSRLNERFLDHAVLDVFAIEPLPEGSPLWSHEHVTVLPHISAPTNVMTASKIVADNLQMFFQHGRIPAAVDRRQGY